MANNEKKITLQTSNTTHPIIVEGVINQNGGGMLKFWKGSIEDYGELESLDVNTIYIIEQNTV